VLAQRVYYAAALATLYLDPAYEAFAAALARSPSPWVATYAAAMLPAPAGAGALTSPLAFAWQLPLVLLRCALDAGLAAPKVACALSAPGCAIAPLPGAACGWTLGAVHRAGQLLFQLLAATFWLQQPAPAPAQQALARQLQLQLERCWPYRLAWLLAWAVPCCATAHALAERRLGPGGAGGGGTCAWAAAAG
jgi:hypothetical protein